MKRSRAVGLTLMAAMPIFLTACDDTPNNDTPPQFSNVEQCVAKGNTQDECQQALNAAMAQSPTYNSANDCAVNSDRCVVRREGDHDVWVPALAGFMLGHMLSGGGSNHTYISSPPIYYGRGGGYVRPVSTGNGHWAAAPVPRAAPTRAVTASRSVFGSSSAARSFGGSSSHASFGG